MVCLILSGEISLGFIPPFVVYFNLNRINSLLFLSSDHACDVTFLFTFIVIPEKVREESTLKNSKQGENHTYISCLKNLHMDM